MSNLLRETTHVRLPHLQPSGIRTACDCSGGAQAPTPQAHPWWQQSRKDDNRCAAKVRNSNTHASCQRLSFMQRVLQPTKMPLGHFGTFACVKNDFSCGPLAKPEKAWKTEPMQMRPLYQTLCNTATSPAVPCFHVARQPPCEGCPKHSPVIPCQQVCEEATGPAGRRNCVWSRSFARSSGQVTTSRSGLLAFNVEATGNNKGSSVPMGLSSKSAQSQLSLLGSYRRKACFQ